MKVSSPVGVYPFRAERLLLHRRGFRLEGAMGAWPATIESSYRDAAALIALMPPIPVVRRVLGSMIGRRPGSASRNEEPHESQSEGGKAW